MPYASAARQLTTDDRQLTLVLFSLTPPRMSLLRLSFAVLVALTFTSGHAQSGKAFFKEGEALREKNQLDQAVEKYTLAVKVDPESKASTRARPYA